MDVDLTIEYLGKSKNEYTLNDAKTGIKEWRGSDPEPTQSELTKGWSDYQAAQEATKYKRDREANYVFLTFFYKKSQLKKRFFRFIMIESLPIKCCSIII